MKGNSNNRNVQHHTIWHQQLSELTSVNAMFQINSSYGIYRQIGREIRTVDAGVVIHYWTILVGCEVVRVSEVRVGKGEGRRYHHALTVFGRGRHGLRYSQGHNYCFNSKNEILEIEAHDTRLS
jgi:hypothetical protein